MHIVGMKMVWVDDNLALAHYETIGTMKSRYGDEIYNTNAEYVKS